MRRLSTVILFCLLSQYVTSNFIADRVTKDIPMQDAKEEENGVLIPVEGVKEPDNNSNKVVITENLACAKVGEFCINHKDCCSNSCLGFMRRCVS